MRTESLESIVVAVLAVYQYRLDKAWGLLPGLREQGLTDPERAPADPAQATVALFNAGYQRGLLTEMFAVRLQDLMAAVREGKLEGFDALVEAGRREEAVALLCGVRGIGPKVAANAWELAAPPASR